MAGYYDASLILAIVLAQGNPDELLPCWASETVRISSTLLKPECVVSIRRLASRRIGATPDATTGKAAKSVLQRLEPYLDGIEYRPLDDVIAGIVINDDRLADCRTLDAIHMATALWFQPHLDEPLRICTLDKRLRDLALRLGFSVLPARTPEEGK